MRIHIILGNWKGRDRAPPGSIRRVMSQKGRLGQTKDISDRIQKASSRLRESLTKEEGRIGLNLRNVLPMIHQ